MTPWLSCSGESWAIMLNAPRSLKEPMGWADSHLIQILVLGRATSGVRTAVPAIRSAAAWISGRVTKVGMGLTLSFWD